MADTDKLGTLCTWATHASEGAAMSRQVISTIDAPSSPLQPGIRAGSNVAVSAMVGIDLSRGSMAEATIQDQTRQPSRTAARSSRPGARSWQTWVEVGVLLRRRVPHTARRS